MPKKKKTSAFPYPVFTEDMRRTHTILVPNMLPVHFSLIERIFNAYGYHCEVLHNEGSRVVECGLQYVHNDTCYPALLTIGQFLDALQSGKYDTHRVALMLSQTGGGCRASNYISLLRKALEKAGYGYVPVISFNISGLDHSPGFRLTLPMLYHMMYALLYGDLLMTLRAQCRPYEITAGQTDALVRRWTERLVSEMTRKRVSYSRVLQNYREILRDFAAVERKQEERVRVGIVGEIYVKFSPLGNNGLEDFLVAQGAETVMPGLLDFCLYSVYNSIADRKLYGVAPVKAAGARILYRFLTRKQQDMIDCIREHGVFRPMAPFDKTRAGIRGIIGIGAKMGEGWLLPAEMVELIHGGVGNIVCAQPFGCLPNHIMGKGVMKPIKERFPGVNIVAVDYDPGASRINQENRIKLMLANAVRAQKAQNNAKGAKGANPEKEENAYVMA